MTHNIDLLVLPAHTSHWTQPMDLTVFGPLKAAMARESDRTTRTTAHRLTKAAFGNNLARARQRAITSANIVKGFKVAGIWPLDPTQVLSRLSETSTPPRQLSAPLRLPLASISSDNLDFIAQNQDVINTPLKNRLTGLTNALEAERTRNTLLERECAGYKQSAAPKRRATGRRTVAALGTHVFTTAQVLGELVQAESSQPVKRQRMRSISEGSDSPDPIAEPLGTPFS